MVVPTATLRRAAGEIRSKFPKSPSFVHDARQERFIPFTPLAITRFHGGRCMHWQW
jgi:hypothetical protein